MAAALISILIRSVKSPDGSPVFRHGNFVSFGKKYGTVLLDDKVYSYIDPSPGDVALPRYLPMLVPPKRWNNRRGLGCYWILKTNLMRTFSNKQLRVLSKASMEPVLEALNYLGSVPWKINRRMLEIVQQAWLEKFTFGSLPPQDNIPLPDEAAFKEKFVATYTPPPPPTPRIREVKPDPPPEPGKRKRGRPRKEEDKPPAPTFTAEQVAQKEYKNLIRRTEMRNAELHSLRCDLALKLKIATMFETDKIYFPYSLDFRGRAYPVPPNLNHLGNDICRSLLLFHEAKKLGADGLKWLKVHLANLFGNNKITHDDRARWTEEHMADVRDSVADPLHGRRWWVGAEEPFQALACCTEIIAAIDSGAPTEYLCSLPVHQDGSCNGLQHYAALGRDYQGAQAVNLTFSETPQDVYSKVLEIVLSRIEADMQNPVTSDGTFEGDKLVKRGRCARLVQGLVDRRVIKQTVMTSVYGVTMTGARLQVQSKLEDKMKSSPICSQLDTLNEDIFACSFYVSTLTLESLRSMFESAKSIMDWFSECAAILASRVSS